MKLKFKEKYLIILVVLCFVSVGFYYSYAIFITKQLQENVVAIKLDNNLITLKIDDGKNTVNIKSKTSKDLKINLHNEHSANYYYLVLVKGLMEGVKVSSDSETSGEITSLENKELMVHVNNTRENDIELEFIVKASKMNNIDKDLGYNYINSIDSFDHSYANKPEIGNLKLIPVNYQRISDTEGYWYKTDETNQTSIWYSYENGIWANAVLLDNNNYNKYKNKSVGTEIEIKDVLGFYVWIPRFKYNIINNSSYTNYERMNNIVFEEGNNTTGTVTCYDQISNLTDKHIYSEICKDTIYGHIYDNLSTYTHPAFQDKTGFWVSKFLIGSEEKSIPNVNILKKSITEANTISSNHNSHVLTNMEYGAIILLSNSAYGKTNNTLYHDNDSYTFTRIYSNTYENGVTGCSSEYTTHSKNIVTDVNRKCVTYNDLTNYSHVSNSISYPIGYVGPGASSTGTISGVYDLASINGEIVAAFVANETGMINANINKYDLYSYNDFIGKVGTSSNIYNLYRYKLGDGIKEHFRNFGENGLWNNGSLIQNNNPGIIVRGASSSIYSTSIEDISYTGAFRMVLN